MDITGAGVAFWLVLGVMVSIGVANLIDYRLRTMAEDKARRAEMVRFRKWGLPAPKRQEEPPRDEHLWHF